MTDLNALLNATTRPTVVSELTDLVERTIANQSGLTGMAIKSAVGVAKKADADAISKAVNTALPSIVEELSSFWQDYDPENSAGFGNYLASREKEVTEKALFLGDKNSAKAPAAIQKLYSSLRGKVGKIIAPALPELGGIIERNAR
ncbi:DUF6918 family protein [Corynebacterium mayonis]|uniref:DUF6918 family protein n=1 Tax=Corynebacterium mayonis TaxID=3062461 RepID=UPI00314072C2